MFTVRHCIIEDEHDPFQEWLKKLHGPIAEGRVVRRVDRIEAGNFGDHKPCREDVWELRVDQGPGCRVCYAMADAVVILLLCGGDKGTQGANIECAIGFWKDWQRRLT